MRKNQAPLKSAVTRRTHAIDVTILRSQLKLISDARYTLNIIESELNIIKHEFEAFSIIVANTFEGVFAYKPVPEFITTLEKQIKYPTDQYIPYR